MAPRIYTKTGDKGETGLFGGQRVPKDHARVEAYGEVDELNSVLGWARSCGNDQEIDGMLHRIQCLLFELGAQLATPGESSQRVTAEDIAWLEGTIDTCEGKLEPLKSFILPGGAPQAAALHVARTACRRAERRVVTFSRGNPDAGFEDALVFLNRLADTLFVLARYSSLRAGADEIPWEPRAS